MNNYFYNTLMSKIADNIKKVLNENVPYYEQNPQNGNKYLCYICTEDERKAIYDLVDESEFDDMETDDNGNIHEEICEYDFSLGGMTGYLEGQIVYEPYYSRKNPAYYKKHDYEYPDGYEPSYAELSFYENDTDKEYVIYLTADEAKWEENYDTPVKQAYNQKIAVQKRLDDYEKQRAWDEQCRIWQEKEDKRKEEFKKDCLANPEKYIQKALQYEKEYEDNWKKYSNLDIAEEIYNILGLTYEADKAKRNSIDAYHREEGPEH